MTTRKKNGPAHVVMGSENGEMLCRNCGGRYIVNMPCSIDMWISALKVFTNDHNGCGVIPGSPAALDALPPGSMTPAQWLRSGDTGISSKVIWSVLTHHEAPDHPSVPLDPDDFGRCYRLLERFPGWRERLGEVAAKFRSWKPMVESWAELEELYRQELPTGRAPKLYTRMEELRGVR